MMKITKWYTKDDCIAATKTFVDKFKAGDLDGAKDSLLYFKAVYGAVFESQTKDEDDDKYELWDNLHDKLEEYRSIAYFIEIWEGGCKVCILSAENEQKVGEWEGEYTPEEAAQVLPAKNYVWMGWTPKCQLKIMKGNPNTDAEFFSGELKVKGPIKLAAMPRQLGYDFFDFLGLEAD